MIFRPSPRARGNRTRRRVSGAVLVGLSLGAAVSTPAAAAVVNVSSAQGIRDAIAAAQPGTVIQVAPGTYAFTAALRTAAAGTQANPITLRASSTGPVRLDFSNTEEGIVLGHADWVLEHVWVNGACAGGCGGGAAGVHVKAEANRVIVRQSRITNWGEDIKSDRSDAAEPTDCAIIGNEIYNDDPSIASGGTGIDIVGGKRWLISGNYVHDFARNETHYGIFVKGGASDAIIERNLVIGAKTLPAGTGAAIGISFGGGGTGAQFCAPSNVGGGGCACETFKGIARNNIVLKTTDAGLHTKRACGSVFVHNTVYDTGLGLQNQMAGAGAAVELRNSILSKGVVGGAVTQSGSLLDVSAADFKKLYADPDAVSFGAGSDPTALRDKPAFAGITDDYFGAPRQGTTADLGAIEFPSTGSVWPWSESAIGGGGGGADAGVDGGATGPGGGGAGGGNGDGGSAGPDDGGATAADSGSGSDGCSFTSRTRAGTPERGAGSAAIGLMLGVLALARGRRASTRR